MLPWKIQHAPEVGPDRQLWTATAQHWSPMGRPQAFTHDEEHSTWFAESHGQNHSHRSDMEESQSRSHWESSH
jgi:myosin-crossreactive antigen